MASISQPSEAADKLRWLTVTQGACPGQPIEVLPWQRKFSVARFDQPSWRRR